MILEHFNDKVIHPEARIDFALQLNPLVGNQIYDRLYTPKDVNEDVVYWKVWADNSQVREGEYQLRNLIVEDLNDW